MLRTSVSGIKCCLKCNERYENCHDTCIRYNAELLCHLEEKEKISKKRYNESTLREISINGIKRVKNTRRKKKE